MTVAGKTVVITGAAGDIGLASATKFHASGAALVLIDIDGTALRQLESQFGALLVIADVASEASIVAAAAAVAKQFGQVDCLFINAGIEQPHVDVTAMPLDTFQRVLAINLAGAFLTAKHFVPIMADGGSIVLTSSIAALVGIDAYAGYSASKAGLLGLMRSIGLELAPRRIRCNTIHPGPVRSRMLERAAQGLSGEDDVSEFYDKAAARIRFGELVLPGDIADLVLFLASDGSRMITGQSIAIDGGFTL